MPRPRLLVFAFVGAAVTPAAAQPFVGPQFIVNSYTTGLQSRPAVAADKEGNFVVTWRSEPQDAVVGQKFDPGGVRRGTEFIVGADGPSWSAVATGPGGDFVVVWGGVFARRYDAAGAPLDASGFRVSSYTTDLEFRPDVATDAAGNFVVVWENRDLGAVFGRRFDAAGESLGSQFPVSAYTTGGQSEPAVAMAPDGAFAVIWSDPSGDGSADGIFGRRFAPSGSPLGADFQVNSYTSGLQVSPDVAMDSSGNFVAVWQGHGGEDGSWRAVLGQRFDRLGNRLGGEFVVNTHTHFDQDSASIAMTPSGDFVVAWHSYFWNGDHHGIFAQRFQADGTRAGTEFHVNVHTYSTQTAPAVSWLGTENFVVVWQSYDPPPFKSSWDVFGRRYGDLVFRDGFDSGS